MSREIAVECFNEMHTASEISERAVKSMREAGIDSSFIALNMFKHGVVGVSRKMSFKDELPFLLYLEEYLADTRSALGMQPDESFNEVEL